MENDLMDRLLNDFSGVLGELNTIVVNKDIDGARRFLEEVTKLVREKNGIQLDDRAPEFDHVLHELLARMEGVIEIVEENNGIDYEPGRKLLTNDEVRDRISRLEEERKSVIDSIDNPSNDNNPDFIANMIARRTELTEQISDLRNGLVENEEFSRITEIDENLKALQEERARLVQERMNNLREIARLKEEQNLENNQNETSNDTLENQRVDNSARIAELQEELQKVAERLKEPLSDEEYAIARAEYSRLTQEISNLTREQREANNDTPEPSRVDNSARIAELQEELQKVAERLKEPLSDEEYAIARAEYSRLTQEISNLTREQREANNDTPGTTRVDNSARIAELEARNKEIVNRIGEIDRQIKGIPGIHIPGNKYSDRLDLKEEAARIGDHIFKTAKIRRELAERGVTREQFLEFYTKGIEMSIAEIKKLNEETEKADAIYESIVIDTSSGEPVSLRSQLEKANNENDNLTRNAVLEQLRNNFIKAGREDELKALGLDHELETEEDFNKMQLYFENYHNGFIAARNKAAETVNEFKENSMIFAQEISRIQDEIDALKEFGTSAEEIEANANERKELRRQLYLISVTPEKELTDEQRTLLNRWQEASERFLSHKVQTTITYKDRDGKDVQVEGIETIDKRYEGYAEDCKFLGVPDYADNMQLVNAYEKTNDPYVLGEAVGRAYDQAEANEPGSGEHQIELFLRDKKRYIESFNGIPNPHRVKYENLKTAGSTLLGMKPVDRDLPATTRAKNFGLNALRFLGIRPPKFTRIDEHGNKVPSIASGAGTLAVDALVVGGVGLAAAIGGLPLALAGYAAKGIVTAGNIIASKIEYSRHKDEIDSNLPALNNANKDSLEVARKEYYREQGNNKFVSWLKAKTDRTPFFRKRAEQTRLAIVDMYSSRYDKNEDERTATMKENLEQIQKNQQARLSRQRESAMSENTYNDIVRDPDALNMDDAMATIARNAALEANGVKGTEDVNKGSEEPRKHQYVKDSGEYAKTGDLKEVKKEIDDVSAITEEQHYTGRKQKQDRINRVLTILATVGIKTTIDFVKSGGFMREKIVHHDEVTDTHTETQPGATREVTDWKRVTDYTEQRKLPDNFDLTKAKASDGVHDVYDYPNLPNVSANNDIAGMAISVKDANGEQIVASIAKKGEYLADSKYVHGFTDIDLSSCTSASKIMNAFRDGDPNWLKEVLKVAKSNGYSGKTDSDFITYCLENGMLSKQSSRMEGWRTVLDDVLKKVKVPSGSHLEPVTYIVQDPPITKTITDILEPAWDEVIREFDPGMIITAVKHGALWGGAVVAADSAHEAAQTTYINGATPGTPEESMPYGKLDTLDAFEQKLIEEASKQPKQKKKNKDEKNIEELSNDEEINEELDGEEK